ncbi:MAG: cysteine desulfurase [Lachnospiraceae bacterium]|nr:cysteine desulfurase [Lachnospiraceae bacterium]
MKEIYFDNASTTKPSQAVLDVMIRTMTEDYGNPSSMHAKGVAAEKYLKNARKVIAGILRVSEKEICFTSGGTESDNWALCGAALAMKRRGGTILTTEMEHPAVSEPLRFLEKNGFTVRKIPVDPEGHPDTGALAELLTDDVILVSVMYVNNEIGSIAPVGQIARMVHTACPHALFHVDAIQAFGKLMIRPKTEGIDLMSVSGHKLHGPKGTGFLYIRDGVRILPLIYGGGQQGGMRSGTENVPGIAGLAEACREAYDHFEEKTAHMAALRDRLEAGLAEMDGVVIHGGEAAQRAPHIVHAAFTGVGSEVLLHTLENDGIYVSAGSACSTHKRLASPTMTAIGAPAEEVSSSVRFSFSELNTEEEVDETLAVLRRVLPLLRRYRSH